MIQTLKETNIVFKCDRLMGRSWFIGVIALKEVIVVYKANRSINANKKKRRPKALYLGSLRVECPYATVTKLTSWRRQVLHVMVSQCV